MAGGLLNFLQLPRNIRCTASRGNGSIEAFRKLQEASDLCILTSDCRTGGEQPKNFIFQSGLFGHIPLHDLDNQIRASV